MIKPFLPCFFVFLLLSLVTVSVAAEVKNRNKAAAQQLEPKEEQQREEQLYIGIETNRLPYISLDEKGQAIGLLVVAIREVCESIKIKCEFIAGDFSKMLKDIQLQKLGGLLITDKLVLEKTDKLKLTIPLCKTQPVFIHAASLSTSIEVKDLAETTIGVQEGSPLHISLLEKYAPQVLIRPYSLLENGLFDLLTQRIDRLATNKAFATANLVNTTFAKQYVITPIETASDEQQQEEDSNNKESEALDTKYFLSTQMTLALREDDMDFYKKLIDAIRAKGKIPYCSDLLP